MTPPQLIRPGDVFVLTPHHTWRDYLPKHLPKTLLHKAIQFYQSQLFPNGVNLASAHVAVYIGNSDFFEVTNPKARIGKIDELYALVNAGKWSMRVLRYNRSNFALDDEGTLREIIAPMVGHNYGYEDLLPFALEVVIGYLPNTYKLVTNLLGAKWKQYLFKIAQITPQTFVCSSGVAAVYVAMHKHNPDFFKRPFMLPDGSNVFIEQTTPAHFDNWMSDFRLLFEMSKPL